MSTKWYQNAEGDWIEIRFLEKINSHLGEWETVKRPRKTLNLRYTQVFDAPQNRKGTKVEVQLTGAQLRADKGLMVELEVKGSEDTHLCGTCHQYSTSEPDGTPCRGCGATNWVLWENKTVSVVSRA